MNKGVVSQIPCKQCEEACIGETGRPLKIRIIKHKRAVSTGDVKNANTVQGMQKEHDMEWGEIEVIGFKIWD